MVTMFEVGDKVRSMFADGEYEVEAVKPSTCCPGYNAIRLKNIRYKEAWRRPDAYVLVEKKASPW